MRPHVVALVALAACSGRAAATDALKSCPIGDLTLPAEIALFHAAPDGTLVMTQAMDEIPMLQPEQGGWVFYVGAHVRNIDGCQLQLKTSLRDVCTDEIVTLESRSSQLEVDGTGWGVPISSSNDGLVAACPAAGLSRDVFGVPYLLHVTADDAAGRHAEISLQVVPTCPDGFCECQCRTTYQLGDDCSTAPDAGVPDAGCP